MLNKLPFQDDFEFNLLNIENFNHKSKLNYYFNFIKENLNKIKGDLYEFGVFNGRTLLATALYLKKNKSKKIVYGFDSFSGFPSYHDNDNINLFKDLYKKKMITRDHLNKIEISNLIKKELNKKNNIKNISTSKDFSEVSFGMLKKKIKKLNLNNIVLIKGEFKDTVKKFFKKKRTIFCCNIDCDLYEGYKTILPYVWLNLSKNGLIYLDEYYSLKFPGARIACNEFFSKIRNKKFIKIKRKHDFERWYVKKNV